MAQTVSKAMSGNGIIPSFTHCGQKIELNNSQTQSLMVKQEKTQKRRWWQFGK